MAYNKQTFVAGQTLTAAHMNHIEEGLAALDGDKQDKLLSGTNIKTLNGQSLLGKGDISISGGSSGAAGSYWTGKELVWNGDSISYGSWLDNPTTEAYPYQVANALGMSISNYAIGGSSAAKPVGSFDEYYWDYAQWQADISAGKVDITKKYLVKDYNDAAKPCRIYVYSGNEWTTNSESGGWALVDRVDEHITLHPDADLTVIAIGTNDFYSNRAFGSVSEATYRGLDSLEGEVNLLKKGNNLGYGYRMASTVDDGKYEPFMPDPNGSAYDPLLFCFQHVPVEANHQYATSHRALRTWFLDANKQPVSTVVLSTDDAWKGFTTPAGAAFMNISFKNDDVSSFPTPDTAALYDLSGDSSDALVEEVTKSTYCGALHTICRKLLNAYKGKNKDFVFVTAIKRYQTNTWECKYPEDANAQGKTLKDYVDAMIEICGYYSIPVIDLYRISGLNPHIDTSLFADTDGKAVHPNLEGHQRMAAIVTGYLKSIR